MKKPERLKRETLHVRVVARLYLVLFIAVLMLIKLILVLINLYER